MLFASLASKKHTLARTVLAARDGGFALHAGVDLKVRDEHSLPTKIS
jgi:hypothetical protein